MDARETYAQIVGIQQRTKPVAHLDEMSVLPPLIVDVVKLQLILVYDLRFLILRKEVEVVPVVARGLDVQHLVPWVKAVVIVGVFLRLLAVEGEHVDVRLLPAECILDDEVQLLEGVGGGDVDGAFDGGIVGAAELNGKGVSLARGRSALVGALSRQMDVLGELAARPGRHTDAEVRDEGAGKPWVLICEQASSGIEFT